MPLVSSYFGDDNVHTIIKQLSIFQWYFYYLFYFHVSFWKAISIKEKFLALFSQVFRLACRFSHFLSQIRYISSADYVRKLSLVSFYYNYTCFPFTTFCGGKFWAEHFWFSQFSDSAHGRFSLAQHAAFSLSSVSIFSLILSLLCFWNIMYK